MNKFWTFFHMFISLSRIWTIWKMTTLKLEVWSLMKLSKKIANMEISFSNPKSKLNQGLIWRNSRIISALFTSVLLNISLSSLRFWIHWWIQIQWLSLIKRWRRKQISNWIALLEKWRISFSIDWTLLSLIKIAKNIRMPFPIAKIFSRGNLDLILWLSKSMTMMKKMMTLKLTIFLWTKKFKTL